MPHYNEPAIANPLEMSIGWAIAPMLPSISIQNRKSKIQNRSTLRLELDSAEIIVEATSKSKIANLYQAAEDRV